MGVNRVRWVLAPALACALFALRAETALEASAGRVRAAARGSLRIATAPIDDPSAWYASRYGIPRPLAREIWRQARAQRVDPGIAFGLVALESRFDPRAVGDQGERGLMQLKLETARDYERRVTPEALFRPETNLRLGLLHLKREVEHFDHDWTLGLLAYNMGRGRVTRALERGSVPESVYPARVLSHRVGPRL